jgi:hypothetical protein
MNHTTIGTVTTNASGGFTYTTTIPVSVSGLASFLFSGVTSNTNVGVDVTLAQFYSSLQLSTYWAQAGSAITFTGSGFGPNEQVTIKLGDLSAGTTTANNTGAFTLASTIPFAPSGDKTFTATGAQTGSVATAPITIAPVWTGLQLGSYAGKPGDHITFIGSGYLPNETITITNDRNSTPVSFSTDASGAFNDSSFVIPNSFTEGNLVLTATSNHSFDTKTITYYVTGQ